MAIKWKNTAELPEYVDAQPRRSRPALRAAAGFLAFVLGVSLMVGSLGMMAARQLFAQDSAEWWKEKDWQETAAFRAEVSQYLEEFLSLGAGKALDWYDLTLAQETVTISHWGWGESFLVENPDAETVTETPVPDDGTPDAAYRGDKNVLYKIYRYNQPAYRNVEDIELFDSYETLPKGYNFFLCFQYGKVFIWKDGQKLDVYGDGIYGETSDWFVPGYENFPAGDNVNGLKVYMAVRETPVQYFTDNGNYQYSRMYRLYTSAAQSKAFYLRQTTLLIAGLFCLALWCTLQRSQDAANRKVAAWTRWVPTEFRFLLVTSCLASMMYNGADKLPYLRSDWFAAWGELAATIIRLLLTGVFYSIPLLLTLVWTLWLIHNDHKYNPKRQRKSLLWWLLGSLRARDLKRPIQKRLAQASMVGLLSMVLLVLLSLPFLLLLLDDLLWGFWSWPVLLFFPLLLLDLCLLWSIFRARHSLRTAKDIGLLADQVAAIHSGNLSTPLTLPQDADLRQMAEQLDTIQSGLQKALEEQTRSERMKVELVSNVSHDLKTPLTSILSYAELLQQEPLEGAAADYARIIDEKAQRLKGMVQDVFEISKAAADQLPVQPERLDFAKLLRQTLADMEDPILRSSLTFKLDIPEEPVEIVADGKRLYRVFQNLIQNALQYSLEGTRVYLTLTVGNGRAESSLRSTSRDELPAGVDFTARFVRGDESRTDGGSGLGLSIAKSFTEACGGEFRVETVADLFTAIVSFPLADK